METMGSLGWQEEIVTVLLHSREAANPGASSDLSQTSDSFVEGTLAALLLPQLLSVVASTRWVMPEFSVVETKI